jgi:hypothetical protein
MWVMNRERALFFFFFLRERERESALNRWVLERQRETERVLREYT